MIDRLRSASEQLRSAWDNYLQVCAEIQDYCTLRQSLSKFPVELSHQFESELAFISSCDSNLPRIKSIIGRARNFSYTLAPINSLPTEILSRILHFVPPGVCGLHQLVDANDRHIPISPDNLTQVCSFWRQVAMSSHSLWAHIDLSAHVSLWKRLLARAEVYVARTGRLPIEVHITDNYSTYSGFGYDKLYEFLTRISNQVVSLDFVATGNSPDFHRGVFMALLHGIPTTLTSIIIRFKPSQSESPRSPFPPSLDVEESFSYWGLQDPRNNTTSEQIEKTFASLKYLYLRNLFPQWLNNTCNGLVDLRLTSVEGRIFIVEETRLVLLLKSSPMLQIIHFGLTISHPTAENEHISPIDLPDLQVVKILMDPANYWATKARVLTSTMRIGSVLRLLAPGSKPLRLSIHSEPELILSSTQEIERLFDRSNITRFHLHSGLAPITTLLRHASQLEIVVLDVCKYLDASRPNPFQSDHSITSACLRSLYIWDYFHVQGLHALVGICPNGIVLYNNSRVLHDGEGRWSSGLSDDEIQERFPTLTITHRDDPPWLDLTAEWDILD